MLHAFVLQLFDQFPADVAGAGIAEQPWLLEDVKLVATRCLHCEVSCDRPVLCPHVGGNFSRDDGAAIIVLDHAEIEPAAPYDFRIGGASDQVTGRRA